MSKGWFFWKIMETPLPELHQGTFPTQLPPGGLGWKSRSKLTTLKIFRQQSSCGHVFKMGNGYHMSSSRASSRWQRRCPVWQAWCGKYHQEYLAQYSPWAKIRLCLTCVNQEGHEAGFAQTVREFGTKWPPIRGTHLANTYNSQIPKTKNWEHVCSPSLQYIWIGLSVGSLP